jgi:hypothetical protein
MTKLKFALRNVRRPRKKAPQPTFDSLEDARAALREVLGWPEVLLGPGYSAPNAEGQVWCAYQTQAEAEADPDGLTAPRIVRIDGSE